MMDESPVSYVLLMKLTTVGASEIKNLHRRFTEINEVVNALQGTLGRVYFTMGEYDLVAAVELPDDETAMVLAMSLTQQGFVTTTTMKAFEIDLVQRLSSHIRQ
jgi:uncharacterized protein with GYD domain